MFIGRRDLGAFHSGLRARSQLGEIRLQELRFSDVETASYLQQMLKTSIDDGVAAALAEKMEGWVTGLRLAALSMRHRGDLKTLSQTSGGTEYVDGILCFSEVLLSLQSHGRSGLCCSKHPS